MSELRIPCGIGLEKEIGHLYRTRCVFCGADDAHVKYFLWVKTNQVPEMPGAHSIYSPAILLAADSRHPKNVFVCPACGQLTETADRRKPGVCQHCSANSLSEGPAKRNRCTCPKCGTVNTFPNKTLGRPGTDLFAIEYYCPSCKDGHIRQVFQDARFQGFGRVQ